MILQNIEIHNFGVFRGKHTFNLIPDLHGKRPIILFGGLNGSGKTTLFEGIKLCLYGRLALKEFRTKSAYNSYLKKIIEPLNSQRGRRYKGAIELKIEFNDFGVKDIYSVRRTWNVQREDVEEKFRVLKNGKMLGPIEQEYSQAFIANLIPMGVSDLFFFDGEKIQKLAEDAHNKSFFKEALDSILGLDVIQTLVKDLKTYAYKQIGADDSADIVYEIEKVRKNRDSLDNELANLHQERASIRTRFDKTKDIIAQKENELSLQGAGYAQKRYEFKNNQNQVENRLAETRKKLREYYSELFPFTLVPDLCIQLRDIIQEESARKKGSSTIKIIEEKKADFTQRLFQNSGYLSQITSKTAEENIVDDILSTLRDMIAESENRNFILIDDFSGKELNQLLYWVDRTNNTIPKEIKYLSTLYHSLLSERTHYENLLRKVPEDSILDPIVTEINSQYEMKGKYETQLVKYDDEIASQVYKISEIERQLSLLEERFEQSNKYKRKIGFLKKIRVMLDEYQDVIREQKMEMLRNAFLDSITMIMRKHNFINDIKIDSNYQIQLQRGDGNYIYKSMLSNGEKQIYAISMLLALAEVSGRPLPFVIDTPLARLDSSHRDNIIKNFFPNASHQVIIFSTDTEIDKMYFEELAPHITRVYHLQYDDQTLSSSADEGYFWRTLEVTHD